MEQYTLTDLFQAIHYCNKYVKEFETSYKKEFYQKKRKLLYHLIRNSEKLNIVISDCRKEFQENTLKQQKSVLYTFKLTYENVDLKVHQPVYSKLTDLFKWKGIDFPEAGDYEYVVETALAFNEEGMIHNLNIMSYFYETVWHLDKIEFNLSNPAASLKDIYESFCYFFPDFSFKPETTTLGKKTIIQVVHLKSRRCFRLKMSSLRVCGEQYLPVWRTKTVNFSRCL